MEVLISWSGGRSNKLAKALKQFLSIIFQGLTVWMSEDDIEPGERWSQVLNQKLKSSNLGVLCLTPENLISRWLFFEAGALAKSFSESKVLPYSLGIKPGDIPFPLQQFQGVVADRNGTWKLVQVLNKSLESPLEEIQLSGAFEKTWPSLDSQIEIILTSSSRVPATEIEREQQRVHGFCKRSEGAWWERIEGDGIGFFQIQMDELHNSVGLVQGRFYNEQGDLIANWNSVASRIDENNSKKTIVYLRECSHPARDAKKWFHGYGEIWFEGSAELYKRGDGMFYDVNPHNPEKTLKKPVYLRRVQEIDEISTMLLVEGKDVRSLVLKTIRAW